MTEEEKTLTQLTRKAWEKENGYEKKFADCCLHCKHSIPMSTPLHRCLELEKAGVPHPDWNASGRCDNTSIVMSSDVCKKFE
jgi:hypothetical protein